MVAAEGIVDYPLELTVDRAELVGCPALDSFHGGGINPQQKPFAGRFVSFHY